MTCSTTNSSANALQTHYRQLRRRQLVGLAVLICVAVLFVFIGVLLGSSRIGAKELLDGLFRTGAQAGNNAFIVWGIRIPQALMAIAVGLCLRLAGAEMQTILNNPMASPFTLGISSAAALGAALAMILQVSIPGVPSHWLIPANAFLFALLATFLLDIVARWSGMNTSGIVLFGIALVFSFNALVSLMQYIASADALQQLVFGTMGSLSGIDGNPWAKLGILFAVFAVVLPWSLLNAWRLTATSGRFLPSMTGQLLTYLF